HELRAPRQHAPDAALLVENDPVADGRPLLARGPAKRPADLEVLGLSVEDEPAEAAAVLRADARRLARGPGLELFTKGRIPTEERELLERMHHGSPSFTGSRSLRLRDG